MTQPNITLRNIVMIAAVIQILVDIAATASAGERGSPIILIINPVIILAAFLGLYSSITIRSWLIVQPFVSFGLSILWIAYAIFEMVEYKDYVRMLLNLPVIVDIVAPIPAAIFWLRIDADNDLQSGQYRSVARRSPLLSTQAQQNPIHSPSDIGDDKTCVVCMEKPRNCIFYKCGHNGTCIACANVLKAQNGSCPLCRAVIVDVVKTYT